MKLRIGPIMISIAASALLLFGGWFAYREWAIETPFEKLVKQYEGVKDVQFDINQKQVVLKLDLEQNTDLGGLVQYIEKDGDKYVGSRELKLEVKDQSSPTLDKLWQDSLFTVAEAMETKQYTEIMEAMKHIEQANQSVNASAVMDENNVYVTLSDGQASKFIILPRIPQQMGVWPNA